LTEDYWRVNVCPVSPFQMPGENGAEQGLVAVAGVDRRRLVTYVRRAQAEPFEALARAEGLTVAAALRRLVMAELRRVGERSEDD